MIFAQLRKVASAVNEEPSMELGYFKSDKGLEQLLRGMGKEK